MPRYNVTQPEDWMAAFRTQANRENMVFSRWMAKNLHKHLDQDLREPLSDRRQPGRPAATKPETTAPEPELEPEPAALAPKVQRAKPPKKKK